VSANGDLTAVGEPIPAGGQGTGGFSISPDGTFMVVANTNSSSVSSFIIPNGNGNITSKPAQTITLASDSVPMEAKFESTGMFAFAPQMGINSIARFGAAKDGTFTLEQPLNLPAGKNAGPRHVAFSGGYGQNGPTRMYSTDWYSNDIDTFGLCYSASSVTMHHVSVQCSRMYGDPLNATLNQPGTAYLAVSNDGKYMFASNMNTGLVEDTIAVYSISPVSVTIPLTQLNMAQCGGYGPSCIALDSTNQYLAVALEQTGAVVIFQTGGASGTLTEMARLSLPVSFVVWAGTQPPGPTGPQQAAYCDTSPASSDVPPTVSSSNSLVFSISRTCAAYLKSFSTLMVLFTVFNLCL
jgi:6-phosphogluconolactonase (cycloisomerase 2 family)